MPEQKGGISPTDFVSTLSNLIEAKTKEDSAAGSRRAIMARFEKLGAHKPGLQLFLKLRNMEPADAELMLTSALRYCRFAQLGIGDQAALFPASDDAGAPASKAAAELTGMQAYEEGYDAGKAGRDSDDSRFPAGSPLAQRFYDGWCQGQAALAAQLDEPLPDDGSPLRKKAKRKDGEDGAEVREAAPSGGKRRGRRGAVAAARQHLGAAD